MRLDRVNEGSFYELEATFRNSDWVATLPSSLRYRIDCETTNTVIRDWTSLTPALTVTITVTAGENRIIGNGNTTERRALTIQADHGTDEQYTTAHKWVVVNLRGIQ